MDELASVLFHMHAGDADDPLPAVNVDRQAAAGSQGQVVLGYLVVFGEVGVIVVLAVKFAEGFHLAVQSQGRFQAELHHLAVDDRQYPGQPQAHRADVGIGLAAEGGGAAAKSLGGRL